MSAVIIAACILFFLLLWLIIYARGYLWIKIGAISLSTVFCMWGYFHIQSIEGYPTEEFPPDKFIIHSVVVKEPTAIFLWSTDIKYQAKPRAYSLPYSRPLHEQSAQIKQMLRKGQMVIGKGRLLKILVKEESKKKKKGKGKKRPGLSKRGHQNFFSKFNPEVVFPSK